MRKSLTCLYFPHSLNFSQKKLMAPVMSKSMINARYCHNSLLWGCHYPTIAFNCSCFVYVLPFSKTKFILSHKLSKVVISVTYFNEFTVVVYCFYKILWGTTVLQLFIFIHLVIYHK